LRIHSWLPHGALNGSNGWTHNVDAREFAKDIAICGSQHNRREQRLLGTLVQFALLGSNDLEQYAILFVARFARIVLRHLLGKQIVCRRQQANYIETLVEAKIPFPRLTTYFVSGIEFLGGSLLTVGFLSSLARLCSHLKHDFAWSAACSTVLERFACAGKR
jgi:hypothetical protein